MRIATIYGPGFRYPLKPRTMDSIRWIRMSEALAVHGFSVDVVMNMDGPAVKSSKNLTFRPASETTWSDYDVIKTFFHGGFNYLEQLGGSDHPFIISKLGSVVGHMDETEGVYFSGPQRLSLYDTQCRVASRSRIVTILTDASIALWQTEHADSNAEILKVPTGVRPFSNKPVKNPFDSKDEKVVVFIGNLYTKSSGQRSVNILWQNRLTSIGRRLKQHGIALLVIGPGETDLLDPGWVDYLGPIPNDEILPYMYFADAGLVLAQGQIQHNESSKIYDYLAAGLPVVSEEPIPNNAIIKDVEHGYISSFDDDDDIVACLIRACQAQLDRKRVRHSMARRHSWFERAKTYRQVLSL